MIDKSSFDNIGITNEGIDKIFNLFQDDRQKIQDTEAEEKKKYFIEFCQKVINHTEKSTITPHEAGYTITNTILQDDELSNDAKINDWIFDFASDLELPVTAMGDSPEKLWSELVNAVQAHATKNENYFQT